MDNEKKGIDVFQDGDVVEVKEIFNNYDNTPNPKGYVSQKTAIIAIIATVVCLMLIAASFVGGFYFAKSKSIESDMPMLQSAYEFVKKYYYEDITWEEFQKTATKYFIYSIDSFSYMVDADQAEGSMTVGFSVASNQNYDVHSITNIVKNSPIDRAEALYRCTDANYFENADKTLRYVNFSTKTDVTSEHVKIDLGDKIVAVSYGNNVPIYVDGLSITYFDSILSKSDDLTLFVMKSDGNGSFTSSDVYQFNVTKEYVKTVHAYLYTPEEIGDTTGTTAMIKFTGFDGFAIRDFHDCCVAFKEAGYTNLILDLRNNGGGSEDILQYVASCLINGADSQEKDIIKVDKNTGYGKWETKYVKTVFSSTIRNDEANTEYQIVNLPHEVANFKMTILANGYSASSSEALIGALQYYNGTQIIGSTTFGKGIGQVTIPFGDYYLYIPNSKYYIPTDENGDGVTEWTKNVHGTGISPLEENKIDNIARPISTDKAILRALTLLSA